MEEKSRFVDLAHGEHFSFLGFEFGSTVEWTRGLLAGMVSAHAEEAHGIGTGTGGCPWARVSTHRWGDL